jgi:hypothetical protein
VGGAEKLVNSAGGALDALGTESAFSNLKDHSPQGLVTMRTDQAWPVRAASGAHRGAADLHVDRTVSTRIEIGLLEYQFTVIRIVGGHQQRSRVKTDLGYLEHRIP